MEMGWPNQLDVRVDGKACEAFTLGGSPGQAVLQQFARRG